MKVRAAVRAFIGIALLFGASLFVACGGSSVSNYGGPVPTPCPPGASGPPPSCNQYAAESNFVPGPLATTAPLPPIAGFSGTILSPPATSIAPINVVATTLLPEGVSPLQARRAGRRGVTSSGAVNGLLYLVLTALGEVTFTGYPGFTIVLPPAIAGDGPFYIAQFQNGAWVTVAGPQNASNGSVTFPLVPTGSLQILAGAAAYFVLYNGGTIPTPEPSIAPSGVPTPTGPATPSSTPSVGPTSSQSAFPSASPSPTPTPAGGVAAPASFQISGIPSATAGTPITNQVFTVAAYNSSNQLIPGVYANPVTLTSGSNAVTLSVNGSTPSTSVTMTSGVQLVTLTYSGLAINPTTVSASAPNATTASVTFAPSLAPVVYSGPTVSGNPEIDLYAASGTGSTFNFTASQAGWTGSSYGNSLVATVPPACGAFATLATPAPSASNFTVSAVAAPSPGTCTMTIAGFSNSVSITVTYTTSGLNLQSVQRK